MKYWLSISTKLEQREILLQETVKLFLTLSVVKPLAGSNQIIDKPVIRNRSSSD